MYVDNTRMEIGTILPLLFGAQKMSENSISEIVQLPRGNVIDVGFGNNGIFQNNPLSFRMLGIRFKF